MNNSIDDILIVIEEIKKTITYIECDLKDFEKRLNNFELNFKNNDYYL